MEIILGETEVRHAQNCASERDKIYRIIYIPYVTNPEKTRILPLPNPFSEQGKDRFNLVGSGLKYRFVYAE